MVDILQLVDWGLDGGALLLAVFLANAITGDGSLRETAVDTVTYLAVILLVYGSHEVWERFFDSHQAVEQILANLITAVG